MTTPDSPIAIAVGDAAEVSFPIAIEYKPVAEASKPIAIAAVPEAVAPLAPVKVSANTGLASRPVHEKDKVNDFIIFRNFN